jgi:hypothetical protein
MIVVNLKDIIALGLLLIALIVIFVTYLYCKISDFVKKLSKKNKRDKKGKNK